MLYDVVSLAELTTLKLFYKNKHTLKHPWGRIFPIMYINEDHLITRVSGNKTQQ